MKKQIKTKERVSNYGEVFTAEREVNAMLDLVKNETTNIESTFLEPACGDGNFLEQILKRKLQVVKDRYSRSHSSYEKYSIIAITSIYGVDLLQDNVNACIDRLYDIWNENYTKVCKKDANDICREACKYILKKNILCGDALTMLKSDGSPITFAEWKLASNTLLKRRDFQLSQLLEGTGENGFIQQSLFWDGWEYDEETHSYIPAPIKEYPLTDYRRVQEYD